MQAAPAAQGAAVAQPATASTGAQPDYSAQWAEYYRSLGKHKEAEAIEAQMKAKVITDVNILIFFFIHRDCYHNSLFCFCM